MVKLYVRLVKKGDMLLEDVPEEYVQAVMFQLIADGYLDEPVV